MPHVPEAARHAAASRTQLAEHLLANRTAIAELLAGSGTFGGASVLLFQTLLRALGDAVAQADPGIVLHWALMMRGAETPRTLVAALAAACEEAAGLGARLHVDTGQLLVFLEIVQTQVLEAFHDLELGREPAERATFDAVLRLLRARDEATCTHCEQTGLWARRLTGALGISGLAADCIVTAAILHDVGKIGVPDEVLRKPGKLDADEWQVMREHAPFGAELLADIPSLARYAPIVRSHHERIDGRGYPDGLRGEEIPYEARVVAVADAFHAMISDRPYRPALSYGTAMDELRAGRGTQWDAEVVDAMLPVVTAHRNRLADGDLLAVAQRTGIDAAAMLGSAPAVDVPRPRQLPETA